MLKTLPPHFLSLASSMIYLSRMFRELATTCLTSIWRHDGNILSNWSQRIRNTGWTFFYETFWTTRKKQISLACMLKGCRIWTCKTNSFSLVCSTPYSEICVWRDNNKNQRRVKTTSSIFDCFFQVTATGRTKLQTSFPMHLWPS